MMALSQLSVMKLYKTVIQETINSCQEAFLDEGIDEQVLAELKQLWESKLYSNKAVQIDNPPAEQSADGASSSGNARKNQVVKRSTEPTSSASTSSTFSNPNQASTSTQAKSDNQSVTNGSGANVHGTTTMSSAVQQPAPMYNMLDPSKVVPIEITLPAQGNMQEGCRVITIQVPATALLGNQLQQLLTGPIISAAMVLPLPQAQSLLQQHVHAALQGQNSPLISKHIPQIDGQVAEEDFTVTITGVDLPEIMKRAGFKLEKCSRKKCSKKQILQVDGLATETGLLDDSSEDDDDVSEEPSDDDDLDEDKEDEDPDLDEGGMEEEPLNSEDDVTDEDPLELFDTDNVVVCQYDKINRSRNKWKFYLKDGIMNLNGKDFIFQKVTGDAEW